MCRSFGVVAFAFFAAAFLVRCGSSPDPSETETARPAEVEAPRDPQPASTPSPARPTESGSLSYSFADGRTGDISDFQGKPVMVMFFSTTCPHCQRAAEVLGPVYAAMQPEGVEMLGLAMDPGAEERLAAFQQNHRVQFPMTTITPAKFSAYTGISILRGLYFPVVVFVDAEGKIQEIHQGREQAFFAELDQNTRSILGGMLSGQ